MGGLLVALTSSLALAGPALAKTGGSQLASDKSLVGHYAAVEGAKLGVSLPGGAAAFIKVTESPKAAIDEKIEADGTVLIASAATDCRDASGGIVGAAAGCEITLAKSAHDGGETAANIAHEVFHVFQAVLSGSLANYNRKGAEWLYEGSAEWVQSDLVHNSSGARGWWADYLRNPRVALFHRSYDAIGFFGHLASSGSSPWSHFKAMFAATTNETAYAVSGVSQSALNSEASVFFREPSLGSAWDQQGPNVPSRAEVGFSAPTENVSNEEEPLTVPAHTDDVYKLALKHMSAGKPVLELRVSGVNVRLHSTDGGDVNQVVSGHLDLCSSTKGCQCPGKSSTAMPKLKTADLAIAGGATGGEVWLIPRPKCETLLAPRKCETLLPQLDIPVAKTLESAVQEPLGGESGNPSSGYYTSYCLFPGAKGTTVEEADGESVFDGVAALVTYVDRYPSESQAERAFVAPPSGSGLAGPVNVSIGDEATIVYGTESKDGESVYVSMAVVRVDNVVAGFTVMSSGGNTEASLQGAEAFLRQIAESL